MRESEHNAKIGESLRARGAGSSPTKVCPKCKEEKPRVEFGVRKNGYSESYCPPCKSQHAVAWAKGNVEANRAKAVKHWNANKDTPEWRERQRDANRRATLKRGYGLTVEEYETMLAEQGGRCAICRSDDPKHKGTKNLHVDHDHVTGEVRGILCRGCNHALGNMEDNPDRLRAAAEYLTAPPAIEYNRRKASFEKGTS